MHSDLQNVLWEDLTNAQARLDRIADMLRAIHQRIEEANIDQPTRQDSKRLNRLTVLADLLYAEIIPWASELTETALPRKNGHLTTY
jgi:hypothetical protein